MAAQTPLNHKLEVRPSKIEGKGVFAREPITKGELLSPIDDSRSVIMTDEEFTIFTKQATTTYDAVALGSGKHRVSTTARGDSPGNYINHSCEPNAVSTPEGVVASRDIAVGEEITTDYALVSRKGWSMKCNCGSSVCRGIVRGVV